MVKALLLVALLTFCCCITTLHAMPRHSCRCIHTTLQRIPTRAIFKMEVIRVSGQCRRTEIIITTKRNFTVCVDPNATWVNGLLSELQKK
uniref:cytokine SCM-1 beta n=1 Tax=Solea senegalensis TaxID=28829 RepID=UPI001CD8F1F8|nr:cytokine SCM-1 beta [Solea senegalensis]